MNPWIVPLLMLLVGCSGLRGKADRLFEQGSYLQAVQTYETALQQDPGDEKAIHGLHKARNAYFDRRLIEVRMARLAGNRRLALEILVEIAGHQSKWAHFPLGLLANTQEEESHEALQYLQGQVQAARNEGKPLKGLALLKYSAPVFTGDLAPGWRRLHKELQQRGKQQCLALAKQEHPGFPYYSLFVASVCAAWEQPHPGLGHAQAQKRRSLVGQVRVRPEIEGLPKPLRRVLRSAIEKAFHSTPWYEPKGLLQTELWLQGQYTHAHTQRPETRLHGYTEKEPYTAYEKRVVMRTVPVMENQEQCNFIDGKRRCHTISVTRSKTEPVHVTEPVTRYRTVPRQQLYSGYAHEQSLHLSVRTKLELAQIQRPVRHEADHNWEGFEHGWNLPQIGLVPLKADLQDPLEWIRNQGGEFAHTVVDEANSIWASLYCKPPDEGKSLASTGNQVHQCLRLNPAAIPDFVNKWYETHFGLGVDQAQTVLSLKDF